MAWGPGRYDDLCTKVRWGAQARAAAVIVLGGKHGDGFSMQGPISDTLRLPTLLRKMADEIERTGPGT